MISQARVLEILRALYEKTKKGKVNWQFDDNDPDDRTFVVEFPHSLLVISYESPPTEPDYVEVKILNEYEVTVALVQIEVGDPDWDLASSLYAEVSRILTRWDMVLDEIESAMKEDSVGLKEAETTAKYGRISGKQITPPPTSQSPPGTRKERALHPE